VLAVGESVAEWWFWMHAESQAAASCSSAKNLMQVQHAPPAIDALQPEAKTPDLTHKAGGCHHFISRDESHSDR